MKQRMVALLLVICLLCTACAGTDKKNTETETPQGQDEEQQEGQAGAVPEISYTDYSQECVDEDTGTVVLKIEENCPVITLPGNEDAQNFMNRAFEQQHAKNEIRQENCFSKADDAFSGLTEGEQGQWSNYRYSYMYETMYASKNILSLKASQVEEMGEEQPYQDVVAYTFYVPEGKLLTLSDVFSDEKAVREIAAQYIQEKVNSPEYAKYLLEDYESYVYDILTEDDFYFNEQGMVIICNPNLLTEYAAGVIEITVPYEALKDVMDEKICKEYQ